MLKKVLIFILFLFSALFSGTNGVQAEDITVFGGEGKINLEEAVSLLKKETKEFCEDKKGYLNIDLQENEMRIEVDKESGFVLGAGGAIIDFSQKCSGSAMLKLFPKTGRISAPFVLIGNMNDDGKITGYFNLELKVPTLFSVEIPIKRLPWQAQLKGNVLTGKMALKIEEFGISSDISFKINLKFEKAEFITAVSRKEGEIKKEIAKAIEKINSENFKTRGEGVSLLDSVRTRLPMDRRPLIDIDPVPEANLLLELFNGYMICVSKEASEQATGGKPWEKCVNSAGDILQRAETYARESRPRETASSLFLQIAGSWDRLRHYTLYTAEHIKYDKVENCERARKTGLKAVWSDPFNKEAEDFLNRLKEKDGCSGLPLFGINQEEIDRLKEEVLENARLEALGLQTDLDDAEEEFISGIEEIAGGYDEFSEEDGEENSNQVSEESWNKTLEGVNSLLSAISNISKNAQGKEKVNEAKGAYTDFMRNKDSMSLEQQRQAYLDLQQKIQDAREANDLTDKENLNLLFNTATSARDLLTTAQDLQDLSEYIKGGSFGDYGAVSLLNDAVSTYADYQTNREFMSHEDAVYVSAADNFGVSLLTSVPILKAADVVAGTPDKILSALGISEDNWSRQYLTGQLKNGAPSTLVKESNKLMVKNTYTDIGRAVVHQAKKVGEAQGIANKLKETNKLINGTAGAVVVGTTRLARDIVVGTSKQTFGRLFNYLGSKFY